MSTKSEELTNYLLMNFRTGWYLVVVAFCSWINSVIFDKTYSIPWLLLISVGLGIFVGDLFFWWVKFRKSD